MKNHPPSSPRYWSSSSSAAGPLFTSENRIVIVGIVLVTLILGGFCWMSYQNVEKKLNDAQETHITILTNALSVAGVVQLEDERFAYGVQEFVDDVLATNADIAFIVFEDNVGKVIYRVDAQSRQKVAGVSTTMVKLHQNNDASLPTIGTLKIGLHDQVRDDLSRATQATLLLTFLSAWLISCVVVIGVIWVLSKQLHALVRGVKRLSTGDFGYRIPSQELWGELKHLAESFNDMSERLRVYEDKNIDTLTFERNKMEAILISITDGVIVMDNDGHIAIINDSACLMLGVTTSDLLIGTNICDYTTDDDEQCFCSIFQEFKTFIREETIGTFSRVIEFASKTLKVIISGIKDTDGNGLGYVMILQDVTRAVEIDRMKTQFISNVSHELRTPVTTIKSYVDTIVNHGNELDDETYDEFLETINQETDRLKKMVNDILDFSRLESPEFKLEMEYQDIAPLINLTVQSVKVLADQKTLTLSTAIESNLPKICMNSDSIERVLRNLLSNAIKYTPNGGRIKVRSELTTDGQSLMVTVEDNGIGIPEEHLPRIWDRFYRVENKVHTVKGTGLGLHLVKVAIEEHHQGQVFAQSTPDQGSIFGFCIPIHQAKTTPPQNGHSSGTEAMDVKKHATTKVELRKL